MAFPTEKVSDNDYRLLGISPAASRAEVKKAYRELVKRWHPDFFQQRSLFERNRAEERFKEITGAYRRISRSWDSGEEPEGAKLRAQPAREEPLAKAKAGPKPAAPKSGPYSAPFRAKPPLRRYSSSRPSIHTKLGILARSLGERIRHIPPGKQRWVGALACVILFFIFFGLTSIPVHTWFAGHPKSNRNPSAPPFTKEMPAPQSNTPLAQNGLPEPQKDSALRHPLPPHPPTLPPTPPRGNARLHFSLGSSQAEVLRIQGPPTRVQGQTWIYGFSEVHFKDGKVSRYNNSDGTLRVRLLPAPVPKGERPAFFTLGSTKNDILLVEGTPTRIEANRWYYGFSEIRFKNEQVEEYDNSFGDLKVRLLPSNPFPPALQYGFFTIGSTMDDVLAIQGTPTRIQGNYWFYKLSNIIFRDKKVQNVVNAGGNLRFIPPEELTKQ